MRRSPKHDLLSLLLESLRQQTGKTPNGAQEVASKRNQANAGARVQQTEMNGNGHPAPANGHLELPNGRSNGHSGHENGHKYGSTPRKLSVQVSISSRQVLFIIDLILQCFAVLLLRI